MRRNVDLLLACVLAAVAALLALWLDDGNIARAVFALPLVLWLPGYALGAALFPAHDLQRVERVLIGLGLSIALSVVCGFALDLTPWGLTTTTWAFALLGITLLASGAALWRRSPQRAGRAPARIPRSAGLSARDTVLFSLAAVLVLTAVAVARFGALGQPGEGFTQLSMVPAPDQSVLISVSSAETQALTYRLVLKSGNTNLHEWPSLQLRPGQQWSARVSLPSPQVPALQVVLYRSDAPDQPYREVSW